MTFAKPSRVVLLAVATLAVLVEISFAQSTGNSAQKSSQPQAATVFQRPLLQRQLQGLVPLFRARRHDLAERALKGIIQRFPNDGNNYYLLASVQQRQNRSAEALTNLETAVRLGFNYAARIQGNSVFVGLRENKRFVELVDRARRAAPAGNATRGRKLVPATVKQGVAIVGEGNTNWEPRLNILRSFFRFESEKPAATTVQGKKSPVATQLNNWFVQGLAAGNHGDLYDNRDDNHSDLRFEKLPQLTRVRYSDAAKQSGFHFGLNRGIFFNAITIGNSSTAIGGIQSHARFALGNPVLARLLYLQYSNNHLYIYPEVRDHDPTNGDLLPANTPYMIISQGKSGSDRPFLIAAQSILAAFRPDVKNYLRENNLVMPTLQMVFRRGQKAVKTDDNYLSGAAHPSVFRSEDMDVLKMVRLANSLRIDQIPPMVHLNVVEESQAKLGVDYFSPGLPEKLFDSPSAIARVVRSTAFEKRIVVSAGRTKNPTSQKLAYHWIVLRGDAERIKIKRRSKVGDIVEVTVPWHERRPIHERPELTTDRVDIGVFVDNGDHFSAPAFISFMFLGNQKRVYDARRNIVRVDYRDPVHSKRFVDPRLYHRKDWADEYEYDAVGKLVGWRRTRGGKVERFTRHGAKVVSKDSQGRATRAQVIQYGFQRVKRGPATVIERPTQRFVTYQYAGTNDRQGRLVKNP